MSQQILEKLVDKIDTIPSLPVVVAEGLRVIDSVDAGPKELAEVLYKDQSLTTTILKFANSAYYGFNRKISTITEAIVILGFNTIRSLLLAASVQRTVGGEIKGYELAQGELWKHSIICAMTARSIARRVGFPGVEQAFIAGLIHDIGKVILSIHVASQFDELMTIVSEQNTNFSQAEKELFGVDHAQIGGLVAERWNLPEDLVDAIAHHHLPDEVVEIKTITAVVHVADALCLMLGVGLGSDGLLYQVNAQALDLLGLSETTIQEIMLEINDFAVDSSIYSGI